MVAQRLREGVPSPHPKTVPGMEAEPTALPTKGFQSSQDPREGSTQGEGVTEALTVNELEKLGPSCGNERLLIAELSLPGETTAARGVLFCLFFVFSFFVT